MALENGYIKLHRKILNWRWYKKPLTKHLFEHLLIIANIKDSDYEKITIKRGQCVASIRSLAADTGLSEREVRTALKHLKETQEVTQAVYPKFSVFTINNYDLYQAETQTATSERHTSDTVATRKRHNNKKDKNDKKNKEEKEYVGSENALTPNYNSFGEFSHVLLTDEQHNKLITEYGEKTTAEYIEKIDCYLEQIGKPDKYKNFYATIKNWIKKDIGSKSQNTSLAPEDYTKGHEKEFLNYGL